MAHSVRDSFDLDGRVAIITGGAGLLGQKHAEAVAELDGIPCLLDLDAERAAEAASRISQVYNCQSFGAALDITKPEAIEAIRTQILDQFGRIDILINKCS